MGNDEEELKKLEEELKSLESVDHSSSSYGSPTPQEKDNMFKFFRKMLDFQETWKIGNLNDAEIGSHMLSIRTNLELATYFKAEKWDIVANFFQDMAKVVASPTMGRKGFMAQLFVTQIKKEQKLKESSIKKRSWLGGKKDEGEE